MPNTTSLELYLKMDEASSSTRYDSSANNRNATNNGTVNKGTGKINGGATNLGTANYLSVSDNDVFDCAGTAAFSIAFWYKAGSAFTGSSEVLVSKMNGGATAGWALYSQGNGGALVFQTNAANNHIATGTFSTSTWYHIAVTRAASGDITFYINGSVDTAAQAFTAATANTDAILFGKRADEARPLAATAILDEVLFYTKALTSGEVSALYNSGTGAVLSFSTPTNSLDLESSSSQYATLTDANQTGLDFSDILTFEGWVKFETVAACVFYSRRNPTGNNRAYQFQWSPNNLNLLTYTDGSTVGCNVSVAWTPSATTWYHIAVTKTGTSVKFYVDGAQQGTTQTGSNGTIFNSNSAFSVGGFPEDAGPYIDAKMGLWRAWSVVRTEAEIAAAKCSVLGPTSSLVGEWTFDGSYADNSGSGNSVAPTNSPVFGVDFSSTCSVVGPTTVKTFDGVTQSTGIKTYYAATVAQTKSVIGAT